MKVKKHNASIAISNGSESNKIDKMIYKKKKKTNDNTDYFSSMQFFRFIQNNHIDNEKNTIQSVVG